jgi:hypothetical protein
VVDKLNDKIIVIRDPDQAQQLLQQVIGQAPQGQGAQPGAAGWRPGGRLMAQRHASPKPRRSDARCRL